MIVIAKASAGSGKTYTLAKTYISLLLESGDPYAYRHVLAVTFTNKATGEMKARILRELDILAHAPAESDYFSDFVPALCRDASQLQKRCSALLNGILHDYSAFSVFTIDRFFQQVLRSFARELGQFDSYQLELDKPAVVAESVDRMLDNLSDRDTETLDWLKESVMSQISSKGYFQLEPALYSAASDLQSPEFKAFLAEKGVSDPSKIYSRENMRSLRKVCDALTARFAADVKERAEKLASMFREAGIELSETSRGFAKVLAERYSKQKPDQEVVLPTDTFFKSILDRSKVFLKAKSHLADSLPEGFESAAREFAGLFRDLDSCRDADCPAAPSPYWTAYRTALQIRDMIYGFGVSRELSDAFNGLLKERNILCLEDSNGLLSRIIDGSDVPFVYEKTGVRYEHFLLDEFQDTSVVQWDNFRPLLRESDSNGNRNLIVGDVKQSIYRWRQSDWNLLNEEISREFPRSRELVGKDGRAALSVNYRTEENIVEFNDMFFEFLRDSLAGDFRRGGDGDGGDTIAGIYSDVRQTPARRGGLGEVRLCFASGKKEQDTDPVLERTVRQIAELHDEKGAGYGDIAVIVRNNAPGERIAAALMERGVPVVSDDSLTVNNSIVVRRLVSVLSHVENPENRVSGYLAASLGFENGGQSSLVDLAESIIRSFREKDSPLVESHALYIQAFVDWMQSWVSRNGNRLKDFLRAWDEKAPSLRIASPASTDAVRIITIHKSKGLEFPYVIIPYFENIKFFRSDSVWARPSVPGEDSAPGLSASEAGSLSGPSASGEDSVSGSSISGDDAVSGRSRTETLPAVNKEVADFDRAVSGGIYKPVISSKSGQTYFSETYAKERLYQCIDAMNLMYVAMTRPSRGLCIICGQASEEKKGSTFSTASDALLSFAVSRTGAEKLLSGSQADVNLSLSESEWGTDYVFGSFCSEADLEFRKSGRKPKTYRKDFTCSVLESSYPSFAADSSRLRVDRDAADFFASDGSVGTDASRRLRGIVLHGILSSVIVPEDLPRAVASAVDAGELPAAQAGDALGFLSRRMEDAVRRGWFTESADEVFNERPVVTADGDELRPDRVSIAGGKVRIIDYKFGRPHPSHTAQVRSYVDAYRALGYTDVSGCLWYVSDDTVAEV